MELKKETYYLIGLGILFAIVSGISFHINSVKVFGDAFRYLEYSENLKDGFYIEKHNMRYFGFVLFIHLIDKLPGNHHLNIIVAQYILSGVALLFLYRGVKIIFEKPEIAAITTALFLLFIEIPFWNSYVLCESLYISSTCIAIYFLARVYKTGDTISYIGLIGMIVFLAFVKPTGIAFGLAIMITVLFSMRNKVSRPVNLMMGLGLTFGAIVLVNRYLMTYDVIENYQLGEIISGVTTLPHIKGIQYYMVDVPGDLNILGDSYPPIIRITHFALFNFSYWLKLTLAKVMFLITHVRPLWSIGHNMFNGLFLLFSYFLFVKSLWNKAIRPEIKAFALSYFIIHIAGVGLTAADWDGRFLMPVLPVLFILSAFQLSQLCEETNWMKSIKKR